MADTHTPSLRLRLLEVGANEDTWGDELNDNVISMVEESVAGVVSVSLTASNVTLTAASGTTDQSRNALILLTGTPGTTRTVTFPNCEKLTWVANNSDSTAILTAGAGTTVILLSGIRTLVYSDNASNMVALYMGIMTAAGQIKFPASQNASADANTLDDYEEGSFTPTFTASGATGVTYDVQAGKYVKVGSLVTFKIRVLLSSKGSGGSGAITLGGLPFTSAADFACATALSYDFINLSSGFSNAIAVINASATGIGIVETGDNVQAAVVVWGAVANNTDFQVSGHYYV